MNPHFILSCSFLTRVINSLYKPQSFEGDSNYFQNSINDIYNVLKKWFKVSKLILHFHKIIFVTFTEHVSIWIRTSEDVLTTGFLGLQNKLVT
jgi:hypothetical protein